MHPACSQLSPFSESCHIVMLACMPDGARMGCLSLGTVGSCQRRQLPPLTPIASQESRFMAFPFRTHVHHQPLAVDTFRVSAVHRSSR